MVVEVKICGLRTEATLQAAIDAGADYVGFVLFPKSPRNVSVEQAAELATAARGKSRIVVLMVDPDDALVDAAAKAIRPDILQLHGDETPERCREIASRAGCRIMKAIKTETREDAATALAFRSAVDLVLFDAKAPKGLANALPGGNGIAFDWHALDRVKTEVPYMLSGGLTPSNVAEAIALTGAERVDVSSGVERSPGEKDPDLIRAFVRAAKGLA